MRLTKEECIERLGVFDDTHELAAKLAEMADEADEHGEYGSAYYLKECAIHMEGLFDLARMMASHLRTPGEVIP